MNFALIYFQEDIDLIKEHYYNSDHKGMKKIMKQYGVISCWSCGYSHKEIFTEFQRQLSEGII